MEEWNPYAYTHEHPKCIAEHVSDALMTIIKQSFKETKEKLQDTNRQAMAYSETLARYK